MEDEAEEDNPPEGQGSIQIPGAIRPLGVLSASELLSEVGAFCVGSVTGSADNSF